LGPCQSQRLGPAQAGARHKAIAAIAVAGFIALVNRRSTVAFFIESPSPGVGFFFVRCELKYNVDPRFPTGKSGRNSGFCMCYFPLWQRIRGDLSRAWRASSPSLFILLSLLYQDGRDE
jgi:hypothetical protein